MASRLLSQLAVRAARPAAAAAVRLPVCARSVSTGTTSSGVEAHNRTPAPIVEGFPVDNSDSPLVGLTGGAPEDFVTRTCRIYRPSRSATQQGPEYRWKIEFDTPNKWVNPLMGWTSARDTAQQLREMLYFVSEEEAIKFAQREGFQFTVMPHHSKVIKAKAFADNFKWKGGPKVIQQK